MNGKIVGGFVVVFSLIFGIVLYYTQVYAYYDRVAAEEEEGRRRRTTNPPTIFPLTRRSPH